MAALQQPSVAGTRGHTHRAVERFGWGALFIWVGIAVLLQVGWAYGLIGVGVIILCSEVAHVMIGEHRIDWFSAVVGVIFLLGGIWVLFGIQASLVPILCIIAGVALMLSALTGRTAR